MMTENTKTKPKALGKIIFILMLTIVCSRAGAETEDYVRANVLLLKSNVAYFDVGEKDGVAPGEKFEIYYDQKVVASGTIDWTDKNISRTAPIDSSIAAEIYYYEPLSAKIRLYVALANRGGHLNIAYFSDLSLEPATIATPEDMMIASLIHRGLLTKDRNGQIIPDLCGDYEIRDLTYTFYISPDARFHTGRPVEAADVLFSLEQLALAPRLTNSSCFVLEINGAEDYRDRLKNEIAGVFLIDKKTIAITLKRPFPAFEEYLAGPGGYIIPRPGEVSTAVEIGAGYYMIKWRDPQAIVLQPFDTAGDAAFLDSLRFLRFTNVDEAGLAFELGKLDMINLLGESPPKFVSKGDYSSQNMATNLFVMMGINNNRSFQANNNFSKALSFLLDRDSIIRVILGGSARKPILAMSGPQELSVTLDSQFLPDSADYYLGITTNRPKNLSFLVDSNYPVLSKVARYIEGQLQGKGFKIKESRVDFNNLDAKASGGDMDIYLTLYAPLSQNPDCLFYPLFSSSLAGQTNLLYYNDEAIQTFLNNLRIETDPEKRQSLAFGLAESIAANPPAVFLYQPYLTTITKMDITGAVPAAAGYLDLRRAFIEAAR